jgi:hypothetical protein
MNRRTGRQSEIDKGLHGALPLGDETATLFVLVLDRLPLDSAVESAAAPFFRAGSAMQPCAAQGPETKGKASLVHGTSPSAMSLPSLSLGPTRSCTHARTRASKD